MQDPEAIDVDRNPAPKRRDERTGIDGLVTKALKSGHVTATKRQDDQPSIDWRATKGDQYTEVKEGAITVRRSR